MRDVLKSILLKQGQKLHERGISQFDLTSLSTIGSLHVKHGVSVIWRSSYPPLAHSCFSPSPTMIFK
jgi:hypothetical protein